MRRKKCYTGASGKGRKVGDYKRMWHKEWELDYIVTYDAKTDTCICLKCNATLDTVKKKLYKGTVKKAS